MGRELKSWVEHELWSEREKNEQKSVSKAEVRGGLEEEEAEQNNIHTVRQRDNDVAEHEASAQGKGIRKGTINLRIFAVVVVGHHLPHSSWLSIIILKVSPVVNYGLCHHPVN